MTLDVIQNTSLLWRAEPERAKGRQAVTAAPEGAASSLSTGVYSWQADLPRALGGGESAPSPVALLLGALAGCAVLLLRDTLAPQLGVTLRAIKVTASCESDDRGLLGIGGAVSDLRNLSLAVEIDSPSPGEKIGALLEVWRQRSPVYLALTAAQNVRMSLSLQGA